MEEKRKTIRVEKTLIVQYAQSTLDLKPLRWDSTTIKNISIDGMLFNTDKIFVNNEQLQLRFSIPTYPFNRIEVIGEVVESLTKKTRIKFVNLREDQKKVISVYVDSLLKNNKQKQS